MAHGFQALSCSQTAQTKAESSASCLALSFAAAISVSLLTSSFVPQLRGGQFIEARQECFLGFLWWPWNDSFLQWLQAIIPLPLERLHQIAAFGHQQDGVGALHAFRYRHFQAKAFGDDAHQSFFGFAIDGHAWMVLDGARKIAEIGFTVIVIQAPELIFWRTDRTDADSVLGYAVEAGSVAGESADIGQGMR